MLLYGSLHPEYKREFAFNQALETQGTLFSVLVILLVLRRSFTCSQEDYLFEILPEAIQHFVLKPVLWMLKITRKRLSLRSVSVIWLLGIAKKSIPQSQLNSYSNSELVCESKVNVLFNRFHNLAHFLSKDLPAALSCLFWLCICVYIDKVISPANTTPWS